MKIQSKEWQMHFHEAGGPLHNNKRPLADHEFQSMKQVFFERVPHLKNRTHLVMDYGDDNFLSDAQAKDFTKDLLTTAADSNLSVHVLTKKKIVISNQHGTWIRVILACDRSNFDTTTGPTICKVTRVPLKGLVPHEAPKKKRKFTKKEKAEARRRARVAMMGPSSPEVSLVGEGGEGAPGPLTQLWEGTFDSELTSCLAFYQGTPQG